MLLTLGGICLGVWLIRRLLKSNVDKDVSTLNNDPNIPLEIRAKSLNMIKTGQFCPQHNWYFRVDVSPTGEKLAYNFCDICKKRPSQL